MLKAEAVVEELVKSGLLEPLLVAELDLEHAPLVNIGETNHVLGQVDVGQRGVVLEHLGQYE